MKCEREHTRILTWFKWIETLSDILWQNEIRLQLAEKAIWTQTNHDGKLQNSSWHQKHLTGLNYEDQCKYNTYELLIIEQFLPLEASFAFVSFIAAFVLFFRLWKWRQPHFFFDEPSYMSPGDFFGKQDNEHPNFISKILSEFSRIVFILYVLRDWNEMSFVSKKYPLENWFHRFCCCCLKLLPK